MKNRLIIRVNPDQNIMMYLEIEDEDGHILYDYSWPLGKFDYFAIDFAEPLDGLEI